MTSLVDLIPYLLGFAFVLGVGWVFYEQRRIRKAVIGHIFPTFYTNIGTRYEELCEVSGKKVMAPAKALARHPKTKTYAIASDRTFDTLWPPGRPAFLQTKVETTAYYEGNPNPIVMRGSDGSLPEALVSADMLTSLDNEQAAHAFVQTLTEFLKEEKKQQTPLIMYLILGVIAIISIATIINLVQIGGMVEKLTRLWGI